MTYDPVKRREYYLRYKEKYAKSKRKYDRKYYKKNREAILERARQRRLDHLDERRAKEKIYRDSKKTTRLCKFCGKEFMPGKHGYLYCSRECANKNWIEGAKARVYREYAKNPEIYIERAKRWRRENRDRANELKRAWRHRPENVETVKAQAKKYRTRATLKKEVGKWAHLYLKRS